MWSRAQGERVRELTRSTDSIFVWGQDAGIYYYSGRRCASRFTMIGSLLNDDPASLSRRRILMDELRANKPRIVIITEPEFPELAAFLQGNYLVAGPRGFDTNDRRPDETIMMVLMDRDDPVSFIDWEWSL
jgi:hypothetical protein